MALDAHFLIGPVFEISGPPVPGMRPDFAAAVALDADVSVGVAALTGLQISPRLCRMFAYCSGIFLAIGSQHHV